MKQGTIDNLPLATGRSGRANFATRMTGARVIQSPRARAHLGLQGLGSRGATMKLKTKLLLSAAAIAAAGLLTVAPPAPVTAQTTVAIDADDIGGVGTGPNGPKAGVWVIAETKDLPTRYTKAVVTDDQGRYVIPDLIVRGRQIGRASCRERV